MREAIEAHAGDAAPIMDAWWELAYHERDAIIEFLKTLQVAPEHVKAPVVDERYSRQEWARRSMH